MIRSLRLFFIPSPENGFHPVSLQKQAVAFYVIFALFLKIISFFTVLTLPNTGLFASLTTQSILALTNLERQQSGLKPLEESSILQRVARDKARDMLERGYFAHTSPDGKTPWYWFQKNGYAFQFAGENLAIDFFNAADVVRAWMNSDSHRSNILNAAYKETGVAVLAGNFKEKPTVLVVQVFGTPKPAFNERSSAARPGSPLIAPTTNLTSPQTPPPTETEMVLPLAESPAVVSGALSSGYEGGKSIVVNSAPLLNSAMGLVGNPKILYYAFLAYIIFISVIGVVFEFKKTTPLLAATVTVLLVFAAVFTYMPAAEEIFGLFVKVP